MSIARGDEVRTEFGRPRGYVWLGLGVCVAGLGLLALMAASLPWRTGEVGQRAVMAGVWAVVAGLLVAAIRVVPKYQIAAGVGLVIWTVLLAFAEWTLLGVAFGVFLVAIGGTVVRAGTRVYRLVLDTNGVHVRWGRSEATFSWDDIDTWWVGIPQQLEADSLREVRRALSDSPRTKLGYLNGPVLMLKPAAGVDHPAQGARQTHWAPRQGRWITTARTDGSPAEIVAALERLAPDKAGREPGHRITS